MNYNKFEMPTAAVILFDNEDIITTSNTYEPEMPLLPAGGDS